MTKLKIPFNLEKALAGDTCLFEESPERFLECKVVHVSKHNIQKYLVVFQDRPDSETSYWLTEEELFMKPKTQRVYIAVAKTQDSEYVFQTSYAYTTEPNPQDWKFHKIYPPLYLR